VDDVAVTWVTKWNYFIWSEAVLPPIVLKISLWQALLT